MSTLELTIAVNGYRSEEILRLCLSSIFREMADTGIAYEVLVADSATLEPTEMLMREEFPQVRFFPFKENLARACFNDNIQTVTGQTT